MILVVAITLFTVASAELLQPSANVETTKQWSLLAYNFPWDFPANDLDYYNPENVVATGIAIGQDRLFLATPRLFSGVTATVSTIPRNNIGDSPILEAYPNWQYHSAGMKEYNCSEIGLVSVYRMRIDSCNRLWDLYSEMTKVQQCGRIPQRDQKYVDICREKQIRVTVKVLVPVKEHPNVRKFNEMIARETMCKMAVLCRGSMKDRKKEEELRASLDPKYAHLNDDLHVEMSALAPAEAHVRAMYALAEVRKYLIPDSNDCIRQEQMREMIADGTIQTEIPDTEPINPYKQYIPKHRTVSTHPPRAAYPSYGYPPPVATSGPPPRSPTSGSSRTVMPAKQKILSILDRARNAMEESYGGYEEPIYEAPPPAAHYDAYYPPVAPASRSSRYEVQDYEPTEYRRDYYHREATAYPVKTSSGATSRSSWKGSSSGYPSSSRHEETSSSKHSHASGHSGHSHSRDSRYRSSPYTRPSKKY